MWKPPSLLPSSSSKAFPYSMQEKRGRRIRSPNGVAVENRMNNWSRWHTVKPSGNNDYLQLQVQISSFQQPMVRVDPFAICFWKRGGRLLGLGRTLL